MDEQNVFTGKTWEEALQNGLNTLGITLDEAEYEILEEGKKKLFGSVKAKVKVVKKQSDGQRAADFVDGMLKILKITAECRLTGDDDNVVIDVVTENSAQVIGKRGDVLDAIQTLAGAVANIGRSDYKKVVVDCENYRAQREETLKALAQKVAKHAVEIGRKLTLEPMNPYERRIIHSALADSDEVKTLSEGREPARYVVVIPNNAKPFDKGVRYGDRNHRREHSRGDRRDGRERESREGRGRDRDRRGGRERGDRGNGGAKRGKKEIYFGTFLGNSGAGKADEKADVTAEEKPEE